ncbi:aromatic ring-hydroxylating dioxygenase subunit alpha [Mesorhizobium sp. M1329]|uniref:aromatic ring-hydroxylating oxygenase subunit alpha n=1 Tax=Mesorhizobium sp. M1329 TaxID=2957083 RepID=UPI00333DBBBC
MYERLSTVECDNENISIKRGLPKRWYVDKAVFDIERQEIFAKAWICVGHVCMVEKPGDIFTHKVVDQEILIVRTTKGELKAYYNVCQHRGHRLISQPGNQRRMTCPYHAWTYDLDGKLVRAPGSENMDFDQTCVQLRGVRLETMCGMIFVNLDPDAPTVREVFGEVEKEILTHKPNVEEQQLVRDNPFPHACNWKASVENFAECYHCGPVHKYLTDNVIDPDSYKVWGDCLVQRHEVKTLGNKGTQIIWHFWPNTAIGLYPIPDYGMTLCIRHMYPIDVDNAIYWYRWFVDKGSDPTAVLEYSYLHERTTGAEDGEVAAGVQLGMKSDGFERAYLFANPKQGSSSEHVIAYFQDLVRAAVSPRLSE